jgi:hypothetical protein
MLRLHQSEFPDGCSCVTTYGEMDFKRRIDCAKHPIGCHCREHGHCFMQKGKTLMIKPLAKL